MSESNDMSCVTCGHHADSHSLSHPKACKICACRRYRRPLGFSEHPTPQAEHTPEPEYTPKFLVVDRAYPGDILNGRGEDVATTCTPNGAGLKSLEERVAVVARIVACYNALAGVDDPSAVKELIEALEVIAKASKRSETMFGGPMSDVTRVFENITRVSTAALAKLGGKA